MQPSIPLDHFPGIFIQFTHAAGSIHINSMSKEFHNLFSFSLEHVLACDDKTLHDYILEDQTSFRETLSHALNRSQAWQWRGSVMKADGTSALFQWAAEPISTEDGDGTVWNLHVLELLHKTRFEEKYRNLFDEALDMIHLVDRENRIIDANKVELEKLGYTKEEYLGKTIFDIIHPKYHDGVRAKSPAVASGQDLENIEIELVSKQGKTIPVEVNVQPYVENGQVLYFRTIMRDITRRKKIQRELQVSRKELEDLIRLRTSELHAKHAQFNILLDNAADSIYVLDVNGQVLDCNKHACLSLGYSHEELTQKLMFDFEVGVPPAQMLPVLKNFKTGTEATFDGIHMKKDGSRFPVEVRTTAYTADGGKLFIAIARDVTEQKRIEREMIQAKEGAEQANKEKSVFLSRMSHELRTPLNAIIGFGQLLECDGETDKLSHNQHENVLEILKAGRHLLDLVNDVLDLSNIESGNIKLNMEVCSVHEIIAESNSVVNHLAKEKNVRIVIQDSTQVSAYIIADQIRIRQVLINLLSNGIKYNKPGGLLRVESKLSRDKEQVLICVRDSGMGMTKDQQEKMFIPFERLGRENSNIEGTGIGLNITQLLVEEMGGNLLVKSQPEKGSEFTLCFKRHSGNVAIEKRPPKIEAPEFKHRSDRKRILYIEDNRANLNLVVSIFREFSEYELLTAMDPYEGIEIAKNRSPSLILLDINLPVMNGVEVLKVLKKNQTTRKIPIVALSANAMQNDIDIALASGFDDYLTKPVNIERLLQVVSKHLYQEISIH